MGTVRYTVIDGEVIAEKRGGVRRQYVPDPLGSTVALLDSTQAQTDTFAYWPYGEEFSRTGSTTATPFRYVGQLGYYQDGANRSYVRSRYLKQGTGLWLTQDPLGLGSGDSNFYRYIFNDPISSTDRTGLRPAREGIDVCGSDPKHNDPGIRKPIGPCRDGGTAVCVTCYETTAKGGNGIAHPDAPGCGRHPRTPRLGDCSIHSTPGHLKQCNPGNEIIFSDLMNGNSMGGKLPGGRCKACDGGQYHSGIDVFVGGTKAQCDKAFKNLGFAHGTNWYCVQCIDVKYIANPPLSNSTASKHVISVGIRWLLLKVMLPQSHRSFSAMAGTVSSNLLMAENLTSKDCE